MKASVLALMASLAISSSRAQAPPARPGAATADTSRFSVAIEAVLHDFPDNLYHISGELVLAEGETENYSSRVAPPGAMNCVITRYHSIVDSTASWQAKMYSQEDFGKAARQYHELYKKLSNCYLRLADSSIIYLKGNWEPAREEITFTTSTLRLDMDDDRYKDVKVELELVYLASDWVVNINIISKKADDEVNTAPSPNLRPPGSSFR
jgi:hypothetical protein